MSRLCHRLSDKPGAFFFFSHFLDAFTSTVFIDPKVIESILVSP